MEGIQYIELMEISKDYCNLFRELYRIRRFNEEEINNFYNEIKRKLIDTKICSPEKILDEIICASKYNNGSYKSYWFIFEKILNDYHISDELNSEVFGINYHNQCQNYSLEIHEPGSIYRAIMEDDNKSFIAIIESDGSYENKLLFSFLSGNPEILNECLKVEQPDNSCMKYSIISHNIDFVTFLMCEYKIPIAINDCINYNNLQAFFVYLDRDKDISKWFSNSYYFNISSLMQYFISHGADINAKNIFGKTALHTAILNNNLKCANYLITNGADVNAKQTYGLTALHSATINNQLSILKFLINRGADINAKDESQRTALHYAVKGQHQEIIEYLISHSADVNVKDINGMTPLHDAVSDRNEYLSFYLISHGADINIQNKEGWSPIFYGVFNYDTHIVPLLISNNADINLKDSHGKTVLHWEGMFYIQELAELFISHGIDVNGVDNDKWTALHYAAKSNCLNFVMLLINNGANVNAETNMGKTALYYSQKKNYNQMTEFLNSHGACISVVTEEPENNVTVSDNSFSWIKKIFSFALCESNK